MKKTLTYSVVAGLCILSGTTFSQVQNNEINSTGKVGINTTTPHCEFEVVGHSLLEGKVEVTDTTTLKEAVKAEKELTVEGQLNVIGISTFSGDVIANADVYLKHIADPTSTSSKLVLMDNTGLLKSGEAKDFLTDLYEPTPCFVDDDGNVPAYWASVPTTAYGILHTGNCDARVGINVPNPTVSLDVLGSTELIGTVGIGKESISGVQLDVQVNDRIGICIRHNHSSDYSYAQKIIIDRDNTKAIGVNDSRNDEDVFRVYGDGRIEGKSLRLTLDQTFWSDYVFEPDYDLMSIEEMEAYVLENKHLPGVPSAKEVEQNGINVVDMDATLLKKIEELSLYIIELHKELEQLKAANNSPQGK